jgi:predicted nucleotidyltransferase component of viral defense system
VRYTTGAGFRRALETRIKAEAAATGFSPARLRKLTAFDRLLARLLEAAPDRWIAKGGLALNLRFGDRARTTMDLDLARQDSREAALEDLRVSAERDLGDFFTFEVQHGDDHDRDDHQERGERYRVLAYLGGRIFEELRVDVGLGDPLPAVPDLVPGLNFLSFAGLTPIMVPTLPLEEQIAQKVHAYTLVYGHGHRSSREKDLVDIVLISSERSFQSGQMRDALERTFSGRGTHELPNQFPVPPREWERGYRRLAAEVAIEPDMDRGHAAAAAFLDPILGGRAARKAVWNRAGRWT